MTVVDVGISAHLEAVRARVEAAGIPAEIGRQPAGVGWTGAPGQSTFDGYAVIWRTGAIEARAWGMTVEHTEARPAIQVTCYGGSAEQVDQLADTVMTAMLDGSLNIPGRRIQRVTQEVGITTTRDPDETPPTWYGGARYRVWTLPA